MSAMPPGKRRIRSKEDSVGIFGSWVFVIIYCAIAFPMFFVFAIADKNIFGGLISGFFAVFGVVYIVWTVHFTMNRLKYGQVELNLPAEKPVLGGEVVGSLALPERAAQATRVRVELRCLKEEIGTDSKGRTTTSQKREWYEEKFFTVSRSGARALAEFRMKVPDEPVISRTEPYIWEVQVVADLPGVDLSRSFVIEMGRAVGLARAVATPAAETVSTPSLSPPPGQASTTAGAGFAPAQAFSMPRAARPAVQAQAASPAENAAAAPAAAARAAAALPVTQTEPESTAPVAALIAANLVPLAGVLFLGWKVGDIVLLYWLENVVIGVMNVARIAAAEPDALTRNAPRGKKVRPHELLMAKAFLGGFFLMHYGAFCAGHATFLAFMFPVKGPGGRSLEMDGVILHMLTDPGILVAVLALFASHLVSYFRNYLGRGEYRQVDIAQLMTRPYGRIVVVHIFIIAGGFLVTFLKSPLIALALFVIIKTAVDLHMHRRERNLLSEPGH